MNVGELIDLLSEHDRDTLVVVAANWGYNPVGEVYPARENFTDRETDEPVRAIIID